MNTMQHIFLLVELTHVPVSLCCAIAQQRSAYTATTEVVFSWMGRLLSTARKSVFSSRGIAMTTVTPPTVVRRVTTYATRHYLSVSFVLYWYDTIRYDAIYLRALKCWRNGQLSL